MKADGFARMDIATDIHHDVKFRRLARLHPHLVAVAGWAYIALLGDSWREGERLTLEETWPPGVPFDDAVAAALTEVGLVEDGTVPEHAWDAWYGAAHDRRDKGRERQRRADVKRGRVSSPPRTPRTSTYRRTYLPTCRQADRSIVGPTTVQRWTSPGHVRDGWRRVERLGREVAALPSRPRETWSAPSADDPTARDALAHRRRPSE